LSIIDLATNTITATIPLSGRARARAINQAGTDAYVTTGNDLSIIDLATNTVTATVGFGDPGEVVLNPAGTYAYVTDFALSGSVSIIDLATNTVIATISGSYPAGLAINPAGTDAYVTNYYNGTVSVIVLFLADVDLSVSGPSHAADETTFTENVTVTNNGPSTATDVVTNVYIPPASP
jgi:YVTN family beta-propeller protein